MQLGREKSLQFVLPSRRIPLPLLAPLITASFGASEEASKEAVGGAGKAEPTGRSSLSAELHVVYSECFFFEEKYHYIC